MLKLPERFTGLVLNAIDNGWGDVRRWPKEHEARTPRELAGEDACGTRGGVVAAVFISYAQNGLAPTCRRDGGGPKGRSRTCRGDGSGPRFAVGEMAANPLL